MPEHARITPDPPARYPAQTHTCMKLPATSNAPTLARNTARDHLTIAGYPGDVGVATEVRGPVVDNAVRHGVPVPAPSGAQIRVELAVAVSGGLWIDVRDLEAAFAQFKAAMRGECGRGLREAGRLGAVTSWYLRDGADGKTVRAELSPRDTGDVQGLPASHTSVGARTEHCVPERGDHVSGTRTRGGVR
ncbi:hypothetical protein [Streptomyces sp. NPDC048606]|uniref:ATP-binding protein n=1 Tax=Streptomyces sp. NPDC048606 TaxID=3154726 RepID=UPI0034154DC8